MTVVETEAPPPEAPARRRFGVPVDQRDWARWTFLAYLVVSVPVLMWIGRDRYFFADEWVFLSDRSATNLHDLLTPYNQHWSTIPIISYRVLYHLFGLHEYWPYLLPLVLAHLAAAGLLRMIMRRTGVAPWTATVVAAVFVLFGPGSDDILWAFQIGFALSVVFGLAQMILADHPGPIDRRDAAGLALGALALLTSGNAPAIILATGLAVLWRRGWRQAAFHTVPLGITYLIWYALTGSSIQDLAAEAGVKVPAATVGDVVHFDWTAVRAMFTAIGHFPALSLALVALLVVGLLVAWQSSDRASRPARFAMPGALAIATAISITVTATQRYWGGPDEGAANRYLGVTVGLALPLFAVAADALIKRWRVLTPVVLALFLVPLPWSIAELSSSQLGTSFYQSERQFVTLLPTYPGFDQVPGWVTPDDRGFIGLPNLTVGWLRQAAHDGKLDKPGKWKVYSYAFATLDLGVAQRGGPTPAGLTCRTYTHPLLVSPEAGTIWKIETPVSVSLAKHAKIANTYEPDDQRPLLEVTLPHLSLAISPAPGLLTFDLCR